MNPKDQKEAELLNLIASAERRLANLNTVPGEDVYEDGTIIRLRLGNRGMELTYVLLKAVIPGQGVREDVTRWYHTGVIANKATKFVVTGNMNSAYFRGWGELQEWLLNSQFAVVSWELMTPVTSEPIAPATPKPYETTDLRPEAPQLVDDPADGGTWRR